MRKRNPEKYAVNISKTERYKMSAVPYLQRLLNDDYAMQKKNLKSFLQVNKYILYNVPITYTYTLLLWSPIPKFEPNSRLYFACKCLDIYIDRMSIKRISIRQN